MQFSSIRAGLYAYNARKAPLLTSQGGKLDFNELGELLKEMIIKYDLIILVTGLFSTHITGLIKDSVKWKRRAALILSILVAAILAVAAAWVQGDISKWSDIGKNFVEIFAIGQIYYNGIIYKKDIKQEGLTDGSNS